MEIKKYFLVLLFITLYLPIHAQIIIEEATPPVIFKAGENLDLSKYDYRDNSGSTISWTLDGYPVDNTYKLFRKDDGKVLQCSDGITISNGLPVTVIDQPTILGFTGFPASGQKVSIGENINVEVHYNANGSTVSGYQWYVGEVAIPAATSKTLSYNVKNTDHLKILKVKLTTTEFGDSIYSYVPKETGTMITDQNQGLPLIYSNEGFPVSAKESTIIPEPTIDYTKGLDTNTANNFYYLIPSEDMPGSGYTDGEVASIEIPYLESQRFTCKVISSTTNTLMTYAKTPNSTIFLAPGTYEITAVGDQFYTNDVIIVGADGNSESIIKVATSAGVSCLAIGKKYIFENLVFDGNDLPFHTSTDSKRHFLTYRIASAGAITKNVKIRNAGSGGSNSHSVFNVIHADAERNLQVPFTYFIDVNIESANTYSLHAIVNINGADNLYFKNLIVSTTSGNSNAISLANGNTVTAATIGSRNVIFDNDLSLPAGKTIRILRYSSRGIVLPESFRYIRMYKSWSATSATSYAFTAYREANLPAPSSSYYTYYDAKVGAHIVRSGGSRTFSNQLADIKDLYSKAVITDNCTLPNYIKVIAGSNLSSDMTVPEFSNPMHVSVQKNLSDDLTQLAESDLIPTQNTIALSNKPENISLYNIDFSGQYNIYNAIHVGDNNVAYSRHGTFYNCKFKALEDDYQLKFMGNISAAISDNSLCPDDTESTLPITFDGIPGSTNWSVKLDGITDPVIGTDLPQSIKISPTPASTANYTLESVKVDGNEIFISTTPATLTVSTITPGIISGTNQIKIGDQTTLNVASNSGPGTWNSSNPAIATVDAVTGVVNGIANGTATITYLVEQDGCREAAEFDITVAQGTTPPQPSMPVLQWEVSTTTTSSFYDEENNKTTTASLGTPVYLRIRPVVPSSITFDSWEISYTATPSDYYNPVNGTISSNGRYDFNKGEPHTLPGTYQYVVTSLTLYQNGSVVGTYDFIGSPYRHTIIINNSGGTINPGDILLQWSVSKRTPGMAELKAMPDLSEFEDVENHTITTVSKGTHVYLQIRPIVRSAIIFDSWEIDYTASPAHCHYPITSPLTHTIRYNCNSGDPHTETGEYVYNVSTLRLYYNNTLLGAVVFDNPDYQHKIHIQSDAALDPAIRLKDLAPFCYNEQEFRIPYQLLFKETGLNYTISFSEEAVAAGFKNSTSVQPLPEEEYITVPVSAVIPKGTYSGKVILHIDEKLNLIREYPFVIKVMEVARIIRQPLSQSDFCTGDEFLLTVEATGDQLSYQWYLNEEPIPGANKNTYQAPFGQDTEGEYSVEVISYCNSIMSEIATISSGYLRVYLKWNDVLYIYNTTNIYSSFQWYKDGQPITTFGKSIYYTDENGLQGSYYVRAYKHDGTYDQSCPIVFDEQVKSSAVKVYPSVVSKNTSFTVEIGDPDEVAAKARIEIYDYSGRVIRSLNAAGSITVIPSVIASGNYIIKVTEVSGKITTKRLVIK